MKIKISKSQWEEMGKKAGWTDPVTEREEQEKALRTERNTQPVVEDIRKSLNPRPAKSMEVERIKAEIASLIDTLPANPSPEAKSTFDVNLNRLVLDMYKAKGVDPHTGEKGVDLHEKGFDPHTGEKGFDPHRD